jgi:predicted metal-dependent HD superfamily phosphohydrolase
MKEEIARKYWRLLEFCHDARARAVIDAAYGEPHRAYHSFGHIADLLQKLDRHAHLAARPDLIAAAIFWHDAVYATRERDGCPRSDEDNVRDSAALFIRHSLFDANDAAAVRDMILATAHHAEARARQEFYPGYSLDLDLFLDLDLSPLAAPWPVFARNLEDIRYEYALVPEPEFCRGRLQLLLSLLRDGARLFRREETAREWNKAARANVARVVRELRARLARLASAG